MMDYFILIKISRQFISFRYFKSGNDGLANLGDSIIPLAVYCNGTEIELTEIARREAKIGTPCYYDDIFSVMQQPGSFKFRGAQEPNNKILLLAIEQKLKEFFSQKCYGEYGSVEDNRNTMRLGFLFDADLDKEAQNFVLRLFKKAGYSLVATFDEGRFIYETGQNFNDNKNFAFYAVMTTAGNIIFGRLYDNCGKLKAIQKIGIIETNPKEKILCELIFMDVMSQVRSGYTFENEFPNIMEKVKTLRRDNERAFQTGKGFFKGTVKLSDGYEWDFEVDAGEIANASTDSVNDKKMKLFLEQNGCNPKNCAVIVSSPREHLDELFDTFNGTYHTIKVEDGDLNDSILRSIFNSPWPVADVVAMPTISPVSISIPTPTQEPESAIPLISDNSLGLSASISNIGSTSKANTGLTSSGSIVNPSQNVNTGKLKRQIKILIHKPNVTVEELLQLQNEAHQVGIYEFDHDIEELVKELKFRGPAKREIALSDAPPRNLERQQTDSHSSLTSPINVARLKQEIKKAVRKNDVTAEELRQLLEQAHRLNITEYDTDLNAAIEKVSNQNNNAKTRMGGTETNTSSSGARPVAGTLNEKMLKREINMALRKPGTTAQELMDLLDKAHSINIREFDTDIIAAMAKASNKSQNGTGGSVKKPSSISPASSAPKVMINENKLKRDIKMAIRKNGVTAQELKKLLEQAHSIGIHEFDTDLNAAISKAK